MPIIDKKVGRKTIKWNTDLRGPHIEVPEQPKTAAEVESQARLDELKSLEAEQAQIDARVLSSEPDSEVGEPVFVPDAFAPAKSEIQETAPVKKSAAKKA
ncbi:MAG TPA: hypothetical protein VGB45_08390 [Abditibacterium sp.]|jgi:hypothetical protein